MRSIDYFICLLMSVVMIVGGYQFYFLAQRRHLGHTRQFNSPLDNLIPFWPSWVWIYSGLYYPVILALVFTMQSYTMFAHTVFSFLVLLGMQIIVFFFFPVRVPAEWRSYDCHTSVSHRLLAFVQSYDSLSNSIPSMHVSMSTLTAIHLYGNLYPALGSYDLLVFAFPAMIAFSAVFTKQHYIADLASGAVFGWLSYRAAEFILVA